MNQNENHISEGEGTPVNVIVDDKIVSVESGTYTVDELKAALKVDSAKVLDQVRDGALKPIREDDKVRIDNQPGKEEKFVSHERVGQSS